ncbi:unnamed protein product [Sympodiomycopsis kandeliae]
MSATSAPSTTGSSSASAMNSSASQAAASDAVKSLSSVMSSASAAIASQSQAASGEPSNPPAFKYIGIALAVLSGILIGGSFVFKKKGLLRSQKKYATVAGEGYAYLKSPMWWTGMSTMILGEIFNFVAYAFAPAILVTPFGALAVVVSAVLSSFFLNEQLTLFGKIGCFLCINGSVIIALNGPASHAGGSINEFKHLFLSPGFLVWGGICIVTSLVLIFFVAPKYGKKNMLVYITICSLLGGLSVSTTSGVGSAILLSIRGSMQLKNWFFYVLLVFVAVTLVAEIIYLNKALELFHTSMVTAVYYTTFTSATLVSTIVLFKGLDAAPATIITLVLGFLTIVTGIVLLQLSKVDPEVLDADKTPGLDRSTTLLMRASRSMASVRSEKGGGASTTAVEDPGMDTMRGAGGLLGSIVRARSSRRLHTSADSYSRMDEHGMNHLNTGGRSDLERYQLHDAPMSTGRGDTLSPLSATMPNMPKRGPSMVSFTSESLEPHGHHGFGTNVPVHSHSGSHHHPGHSHGILSPPQHYGHLGSGDTSRGRFLDDIKEGVDVEPGVVARDYKYNSTLSGVYPEKSSSDDEHNSSKDQANVYSKGIEPHQSILPRTDADENNYDLRNMFNREENLMSSPESEKFNPLSTFDSRDSLAGLQQGNQLSTFDSRESLPIVDSQVSQRNKSKYPQQSKKKRNSSSHQHNDSREDDREAEELLSPKFRSS